MEVGMEIPWTIAIIKDIQLFHLINLQSQDNLSCQIIIKVSNRKTKIVSLPFQKLEEIRVILIIEKVKNLTQIFVIHIRNLLRAVQINLPFNLEIIFSTIIILILDKKT